VSSSADFLIRAKDKRNKKTTGPDDLLPFYIRNEKKKGRCLSLVYIINGEPLAKLEIQ
jgi:hypothetical protein